jgi:hypothetical protein
VRDPIRRAFVILVTGSPERQGRKILKIALGTSDLAFAEMSIIGTVH